MRSLILVCLLATSALALLVSGAPMCPSLPVKLELRTSANIPEKYQIVFASLDPEQDYSTEFVDIHYRINNDDSVNLRVMTQDVLSTHSVPAKHAAVDGIALMPGDSLRAYATYSAKGYACDTPIYTFNAPEPRELEQFFQQQAQTATPMMRRPFPRMITTEDSTTTPMTTSAVPIMRRPIRSNMVMRRNRYIDTTPADQFWSQAALEENEIAGASCPAVPLDQDLVKIQGLDNTYMLSLENRNPAKQLHYVDLHLSTNENKGWDNLRLASDMQLNLAHRVMQPGIVIKPTEQLKWYWSYRATGADGLTVDCTTPVSVISPEEVTHEITLTELAKAAQA